MCDSLQVMFVVYSLQSISDSDRYYIGITEDLAQRLEYHNGGKCIHTAKYKPWRLMVSIQFADEAKARAFERYLKSGSGRAFAKKRF